MTFPQYNSPLRFPQTSGVVEALQNDLTLRASTSGDVLVSFLAALRPEVDAQQDLGRDFLRWRNLHISGINSIPIGDYIAPQTSLNNLSGVVTLTSPNSSIGIGDNGQAIELSGIFTWASGQIIDQKCEDITTISGVANTATQKTTLTFTESSGTLFAMQHDLNTLDFVFTMWRGNDNDTISYTLPDDLYPSGFNHVAVQLDVPMSGKLVLIG